MKQVGFSVNLLGASPVGCITVQKETVLYLPHLKDFFAMSVFSYKDLGFTQSVHGYVYKVYKIQCMGCKFCTSTGLESLMYFSSGLISK